MSMTDAQNRLRILAEAYHGKRVEVANRKVHGEEGFIVSAKELEAVTVAAAILGMFVEALENTTT